MAGLLTRPGHRAFPVLHQWQKFDVRFCGLTAAGVFAKDNLLDEINADATGILSDYIIEHPEAVHTCVDLVSVFRKLERSGDHITNIAEEIVFFIDAKVLKHRGKTDENYPEK